MSHIVSVKTEVRDPQAVVSACRRLGLPEPVTSTATLFSGEATGLLIRLPDRLYPVVFDPATGQVKFDNYEGGLGRPETSRSLLPTLRRGEGPHRGPQAGPQRRRAGPPRRLGEAHDPGGRCLLKTIEITISPRGETKVETRGFTGSACKEARRFIEQALGQRTAETLTPEFYQSQQASQELEQSR